MLRYITGGESHGPELTAIVDGMPSGLRIAASAIDNDLKRRQGGYGRGARQQIERDRVRITGGVRHGKTLGSPVSLVVTNRDWENWLDAMSVAPKRGVDKREVTRPRPGHADLAGAMKYAHDDLRNVLERSSARETAARVAVGALAKALLKEFGIGVVSYVLEIGGEGIKSGRHPGGALKAFEAAEASDVRCSDRAAAKRIRGAIDRARKRGDSLGGLFEVAAIGVPPGIGSHTQWDRKLDARLAAALMSVQAIKSVEVGLGRDVAFTPGSRVQDEIFYGKRAKGAPRAASRGGFWPLERGFYRKTNNAGGIEGGMSNGETILLRGAMKPIPTLYKPLRSADIASKRAFKAAIERSDICAVPAASVVAEAVVAFELARGFLEKFGGDSIGETKRNYRGYLRQLSSF